MGIKTRLKNKRKNRIKSVNMKKNNVNLRVLLMSVDITGLVRMIWLQ